MDIDAKTYNIDPNKIEKRITPKTKAILAQNTFGLLTTDLDEIFKLAKKYNLHVVEYCARGFGGFYKGKPNGTIADVKLRNKTKLLEHRKKMIQFVKKQRIGENKS